jgi:hypothetical protein
MAPHSSWFRARVNSGRLAEPATYRPSAIVAPGPDAAALPRHGSVAPDASLPGGGRLRGRLGAGYVLVVAERPPPQLAGADAVVVEGGRYGAGRTWLVRPDGYLADSAALADTAGLERIRRVAAS